jgi:ATP-dependent Clp protease, protease subunit
MSDRVIRIIGSIDEAAFKEFSEQMAALEDASRSPIKIILSSGGGSAYDALAFSARMRLSPCRLMVTAYGLVASAAVLVLASGSRRYMTKESWVMVHEDSDKLNGNVVELEREVAHLRRMEDQWAELLELCTDISAATWTKLHKETTYLTPAQCLKLGLVEEII